VETGDRPVRRNDEDETKEVTTMTQFLLSVHMIEDAPPVEEDQMQRAYDQVDRLNAELQAAGVWVFAGGLLPASTATVVRADGDEVLVTDGPFTESKEHIGGFWVIEAPDLDAALAWASKATRACTQPVEVRPFQENPES
jgi:hypothetical protein